MRRTLQVHGRDDAGPRDVALSEQGDCGEQHEDREARTHVVIVTMRARLIL